MRDEAVTAQPNTAVERLTTEQWIRQRLDNTQLIAAKKTGKDRDGWLDDEAYLADVLRILASHAALVEACTRGISIIDVAVNECPIRTSPRWLAQCPKCGATPDKNCGPSVRAHDELERVIRAALKSARGG